MTETTQQTNLDYSILDEFKRTINTIEGFSCNYEIRSEFFNCQSIFFDIHYENGIIYQKGFRINLDHSVDFQLIVDYMLDYFKKSVNVYFVLLNKLENK